MLKQISWHFRGPIRLKQFASYTLGSDNSKRDLHADSHPHQHKKRYAHKHLHRSDHGGAPEDPEQGLLHEEEKRAIGDWVTATIDGKVASWINEYGGPGGGAPAATPALATGSGGEAPGAGSGSGNPPPSAPSPAPSMNAGSGNWGRQAYYNAAQSTAEGLVFLNYHGGQGSGVFDT